MTDAKWTDELLEYDDLWLIGAGGKTSLMYRLADRCEARSQTVICATTTKIYPPTREQCADFRTGEFLALTQALARGGWAKVVVAGGIEKGKCVGFPVEETMKLGEFGEHLIVEADGSAGKGIKAHREGEPCVSNRASCVVAVVGGWTVGRRIDETVVHRAEIFAGICGKQLGDVLAARDVAEVILVEEGWLRDIPNSARVYVVVTGAPNGIPDALRMHGRAGRIAGVFTTDAIRE